MNAMIPYGLINITTTELQRADPTDRIELRHQRQHILYLFWKVHDVTYKTSQHISDARSRNLFWRTWSNRQLSDKISTATLTAHWNRCRGEINLSPLEVKLPPSTQIGSNTRTHNQFPTDSDLTLLPRWRGTGQDVGTGRINHQNGPLNSVNIRTEPGYIDISQLRDLSLLSPTDSATTEGTASGRPRQIRAPSHRNASTQSSVGNRTRATNRGRVRPAPIRRKSSQNNSQNTKAPRSPGLPLRKSSKDDDEIIVSPSQSTSTTIELPSPSSWEDDTSLETKKTLIPDQSPSAIAELHVEPGFRSKFAERVASTSNLAGMNRIKKTGSVVRFADENPIRDGGVIAPLSTTFEEDVRPRLPHRPSTSSVAISDSDSGDDESINQPLHRTASSLSMALAEERRIKPHSNKTSHTEHNHREGKQSSAPTEVDQLLAMGRSGGVTKAGGIQVPSQHRLKDDLAPEYSSPESELIF